MLTNFNKKIEIAANLAIIIIAVLIGVVVVKDHLLTHEAASTQQSINQAVERTNQITKGDHLSSLDVDWKQSRQTLVLAISSACHFCTESASFYKTLVQNKKDTRLVAVLPQSVEEGKGYLQKLGVSVDEVRQLPLDKISVRGTPTLLLVDTSGSVKNSWIGKLAPQKEEEVLRSIEFSR